MMYIFEGVDHAGKNALMKYINAYHRIKYGYDIPIFDGFNVHDKSQHTKIHRFVKDKDEWQKAIGFEVINFCEQTKIDVMINRFTWSEIVYGKVFRGDVNTKWYQEMIEEKLQGIAKIIYVTAPIDVIKNRLLKSKRDKTNVIEKLDKLIDAYEKLVSSTKLEVLRVESTSEKDLLLGQLIKIHTWMTTGELL